MSKLFIFSICAVFVTFHSAVADEKVVHQVEAPKTIAPVFATASLKVAKKGEDIKGAKNAKFALVVDCPQVRWGVKQKGNYEGKIAEWKEFEAQVNRREIVIDFASASQVPESKVMRLDGKVLTHQEIQKAFAKDQRVLLSLTGEEVDPYYRKFYRKDLLVIVLARDEGMGNERLMSKKG